VGFYAVIVCAAWVAVSLMPEIKDLFREFQAVSAIHSIGKESALTEAARMPAPTTLGDGPLGLITLLSMVVAFALAVPAAWVYMTTKRYGNYDESVLQTVLVLPMLIAGTLILVQNSLALAFALGGIVAATRFRNTLKDVKDMVYIVYALGIGLAAGVYVPVVPTVMSFTFNVTVLALWYLNVGNIYDRRGLDHAVQLDAHIWKGYNDILLVRTARLKSARRVAETLLSEYAKRWKLAEVVPTEAGMSVLGYVIRVKSDNVAHRLIDELRAHGSPDIVQAELRSVRGLNANGDM
jgi:hypothetical protein